jgi:DNA-binding SARP family transcriptional activator/tetratricopeptide (TPR) repeat protein
MPAALDPTSLSADSPAAHQGQAPLATSVDAAAAGRLQLCGEPAFVHPDGRRTPIEAKDAMLLAYLAIEGPTPRSRLAALLWPEVDRERARTSLRQRLFRLRRLLGFEPLQPGETTELAAGLATDLAPADPEAEASLAPLLGSFEWRGGGETATWLAASRAQHADSQIDRLARQSSEREARGELVISLRLAQRLVAAQPTSEHAHRRVMRLHHLRGDRASALAAYERCVQLLDDELGTAPSTETRALARQIDGQPDSPASAANAIPVTVLRPPRLIGRESHWQTLESAWHTRSVAIVVGEAGMGKTRLIGDFAAGHPGMLVITARPGDARSPYSLLSRLLHGLLPSLHAPLTQGVTQELARLLPSLGSPPPPGSDSESAQARFLSAARALLSHASESGSPVAVSGIVIDDIQFADVASIEAVQSLMGADAPVRWILACRPVELPAETQALCDELREGQAALDVLLLPLTETQVQALIASLAIDALDAASLAGRLTRHTGGNPMFLLETLKAMVLQPGTLSLAENARLPAVGNVTDLIQRRLTRLSPDAVRLARCAALTGQDFSGELAVQVLGVRPLDMADAWNELEVAQVFRGGAFAHDLIFEAALASVPAPIATLLHGQIAGYLEARGHAPARVAQHWLAAGELARGAEALLAAAAQAERLMRFREMCELLQRAADVFRELGEMRRSYEALRKLQTVVNAIGTRAQRDAVFRALMASAEGPTERHSAVAENITLVINAGRLDEALELACSSVAESEQNGGPPHQLAELRSKLGGVLSALGSHAEAEAQYRLAEPMMREHPDVSLRYVFLNDFGVFLDNLGRHREARIALLSAIDSARTAQETNLLCNLLGNLGSSFYQSGLARRAAETIEEGLRLRRLSGLLSGGASFMNLGVVQRSLGEYAASIANLEAQREHWRGDRDAITFLCHSSLAVNYLDLGQAARAQQELNTAQVSKATGAGHCCRSLVVRARLAAALGKRPDGLLAEASALLPSHDRSSRSWRQLQLERSLTLEGSAGLALASEVLAAVHESEQFGAQISAHTRCARAALRAGELEVALRHSQQAVDLMSNYDPDDMYRAEVGHVAWQALHTAGAREARALLEQTVTWVLEIERMHVPEMFRESFRSRNPVNAALFKAVSQQASG